ncbi:hypothetical protein SK128_019424, partial [Halocaridina rubra]
MASSTSEEYHILYFRYGNAFHENWHPPTRRASLSRAQEATAPIPLKVFGDREKQNKNKRL